MKEKKQKTIHFQKVLQGTSLALTAAAACAMVLIVLLSIRTFQDQTYRSSATLLDFYIEELSANTDDMKNSIINLYNSDPGFSLLSMKGPDNSERLSGDYLLRSKINNLVPYDGLIAAFDETGTTSIWQVGSGFPREAFMENYALEKGIEQYIKTLPRRHFAAWNLYQEGDHIFIVYPLRKNDFFIAACIDLSKFIVSHGDFENTKGYDLAFYDDKDILTNRDVFGSYGITPDAIRSGKRSFHTEMRYILQSSSIEDLPVSIASIMPVSQYLSHYRVFIFLIIVIFAILALLIAVLFAWFRRILAYPLRKITEASELLSDPHNLQPAIREDRESRIYELQHINDALFKLVNQKVMSARESERRKLEQEHAQLQYFQLQTRSHFFLNCLKSLYNMLEMQQYDKMKRMILKFSDHIRFIFHDNLSLIPLRDELAEINDYADIIRMDASKPLLVVQNVPEELENCLVPPLVIQTFLENSVKHNSESGESQSFLVFAVEADKTTDDSKEYLRLRLSDNGSGYSKDMLDKLNFDSHSQYEQYHVGISNLKRRMQILYHDDCSIAFFNDAERGGAIVRIYLPILTQKEEVPQDH